MSSRKKTYLGLILLVLIGYQFIGYYDRNLRVESELLDVVVEQVIVLEEKRINGFDHTIDEDERLYDLLNYGEFGRKSHLEFEIVSQTLAMSKCLNEYSVHKSKESMDKYFGYLDELKEISDDLRSEIPALEKFWVKGIFED